MSRTFHRLFIEHPRQVEESYFKHLAASSRFGFRLLKLSLCAFAHALIPGIHRATVSNAVCGMADEVSGRARVARESRMREAGVWDPGL